MGKNSMVYMTSLLIFVMNTACAMEDDRFFAPRPIEASANMSQAQVPYFPLHAQQVQATTEFVHDQKGKRTVYQDLSCAIPDFSLSRQDANFLINTLEALMGDRGLRSQLKKFEKSQRPMQFQNIVRQRLAEQIKTVSALSGVAEMIADNIVNVKKLMDIVSERKMPEELESAHPAPYQPPMERDGADSVHESARRCGLAQVHGTEHQEQMRQTHELLQLCLHKQVAYLDHLAQRKREDGEEIREQDEESSQDPTASIAPEIPEWLVNLLLEKANTKIRDFVDTLFAQEEWVAHGRSVPDDITIHLLLTGAPGTGKSLTAQALAQKFKRPYIHLTPATAGNRFQFCMQEYLKKELEPWIKAEKPCVIVADEIDQLNAKSDGAEGKTGENPGLALCNYIDLCDQINRKRGYPVCILIGTTNNKDGIPSQLLSRMESIEVQCPDLEIRMQVLDHYINSCADKGLNVFELSTQECIESLAKKMKNLSLRDIHRICGMAAQKAMVEAKKQKSDTIKMRPDHFDQAFTEHYPDTPAYKNRFSERAKKLFMDQLKRQGQMALDETTRAAMHKIVYYSERQQAHQQFKEQEANAERRHQDSMNLQQKLHQDGVGMHKESMDQSERHYTEQNSLGKKCKEAALTGLIGGATSQIGSNIFRPGDRKGGGDGKDSGKKE